MLGQAGGMVMPQEKTLLIVDDDKSFATRLGRAMETRGFEVRMADGVQEGLSAIRTQRSRRSGAWARRRRTCARGCSAWPRICGSIESGTSGDPVSPESPR